MLSSSSPGAARPDLAEPTSLFESLHVLRSENPHYKAIIHPSAEQIADLNAVIKSLRLELDGGVDEATGDETAYELAVALLWHSDTMLIEEGVQLMEYLLKKRWDYYWITVVHDRPVSAVGNDRVEDGGAACTQLVESVPDENDLDDGEASDDGRKNTSGRPAELRFGDSSRAVEVEHVGIHDRSSNATAKSTAHSEAQAVLRGSAVQFATAPPPPEDECGSVPPSLVRDRGPPLEVTPGTSGAPVAASCSSGVPRDSTAGTRHTKTPWCASSSRADATSSSAKSHSSTCGDTHSHHERLAKCYYNLAVGCTKLRHNDKALFYVSNMLRLRPDSEDGLLLRRLLCARLYLGKMFMLSVPLLAFGLLFL
ncbi:hypothetical protein LSCM1_00653 [Leishmania martiniquensis]|uniref:Uncharacterized protein n=1 Tax=Leishmania martiniquensis TaxID=1580590 RepID=A0A836K642_9TRYP|nr:hypothetical protein LSCM1_00653 [Leishmania martiniquensis]